MGHHKDTEVAEMCSENIIYQSLGGKLGVNKLKTYFWISFKSSVILGGIYVLLLQLLICWMKISPEGLHYLPYLEFVNFIKIWQAHACVENLEDWVQNC